jgi:PAS domain S-box-containing protein
MKRELRVLIVEDSEFDARMMVSLLRQAGWEVIHLRVETAAAMRDALTHGQWDCVLSDYNLPEFSAPEALRLLQESGLDLPFIVISGGIGEDIAVAAMKAGAHDYLMKGNLQRLAPAVERELREAFVRTEERRAKQAVRDSEVRYRTLWETCPDAVLVMEAGGHIRFANAAVSEVFGYTPQELKGQPFARLQPTSSPDANFSLLLRCIEDQAAGVRWHAVETRARRRDGAEIPVEVSFSDMILDGRRHFVAFGRDITKRKLAEKALIENEREFLAAREIQQHLFPKKPPTVPGFDIAGASFPAALASGDYFDYLPMLHQRMAVVIGDVSGHGVGPALLMAMTRAYLRLLVTRRESPGEILTLANTTLVEDMASERFLTLCLARIDPETRSLVYANAGHSTAYLLDPAGELKLRLQRTGVALGWDPKSVYTDSDELKLDTGDVLVLATDGIEEAVSADGNLFGLERLLDVVRAHRHESASLIVEALYAATRSFTGDEPQEDDITAVVVKVLAASSPGASGWSV